MEKREGLPPEIQSLIEARLEGGEKMRSYYREDFVRKKNDYSDELPEQDVRNLIGANDRFTQYKCQRNFILGLNLALRGCLEHNGFRKPETEEAVNNFLHHQWSTEQEGGRTTPEEIRIMNSILDVAIEDLAA